MADSMDCDGRYSRARRPAVHAGRAHHRGALRRLAHAEGHHAAGPDRNVNSGYRVEECRLCQLWQGLYESLFCYQVPTLILLSEFVMIGNRKHLFNDIS